MVIYSPREAISGAVRPSSSARICWCYIASADDSGGRSNWTAPVFRKVASVICASLTRQRGAGPRVYFGPFPLLPLLPLSVLGFLAFSTDTSTDAELVRPRGSRTVTVTVYVACFS